MKVAMFPKGAINHPSLFVSSCILFEEVKVLHPKDVIYFNDNRESDKWQGLSLYENHNADSFWKISKPLIEKGVLTPFVSGHEKDISKFLGRSLDKEFAIPDFLKEDCYGDIPSNSGIEILYALGFTEFFDYLRKTNTPTVCSHAERVSDKYLHGATAVDEISFLSDLSARVLASCIPDLGTEGSEANTLIKKIIFIRENTQKEIPHYQYFIGSLAKGITSLMKPEERVGAVESIVRDTLEVWEAYTSKLREICEKLSIPIRFGSICKSIFTLDFLGIAKDSINNVCSPALLTTRQQERAFSFIRHAKEINDFWLT
jgi:hypothetical protein